MSQFLEFGRELAQLFDERLGSQWTKRVLYCIVFAVIGGTGLILFELARAISSAIVDMFSFILKLIDFDGTNLVINAVATAMSFIFLSLIIFVLLISVSVILQKGLSASRVKQSSLDELARLRNRGIEDVFNSFPNTMDEYAQWKSSFDDWSNSVLECLKKNFPKADYDRVSHIGIVTPRNFPDHITNPDNKFNISFQRDLSYFTERLRTIEEILSSYRR